MKHQKTAPNSNIFTHTSKEVKTSCPTEPDENVPSTTSHSDNYSNYIRNKDRPKKTFSQTMCLEQNGIKTSKIGQLPTVIVEKNTMLRDCDDVMSQILYQMDKDKLNGREKKSR